MTTLGERRMYVNSFRQSRINKAALRGAARGSATESSSLLIMSGDGLKA